MLVAAALCWSVGGVLIKYVAWHPLAVASGRGLLAAVFLAFLFRPLRFTFSPLQLSAAAAYAACTITFVTATKLTSAANAILLQYTAPVWVALFSGWVLNEKPKRVDWITLAVVLAGMGLFFAEELELRHAWGNVIAILSGVFFATMTLLLRKQKDGSPVESIILGNVIAGAVGLPFMLQSPSLPLNGWISLGVLGIVQLGVSYALYARAIRHVTALEMVLIPVLEPILNPVWALVALQERPSRWALIGGSIVLSAVTARAVLSIRQAKA